MREEMVSPEDDKARKNRIGSRAARNQNPLLQYHKEIKQTQKPVLHPTRWLCNFSRRSNNQRVDSSQKQTRPNCRYVYKSRIQSCVSTMTKAASQTAYMIYCEMYDETLRFHSYDERQSRLQANFGRNNGDNRPNWSKVFEFINDQWILQR